MRAKVLCLFALLPSVFFASTDFAAAGFAPYGGDGGTAFSTSCPANQYVAGFFGRVGDWLDDIGLTCAPAIGNTGFGAPVQTPQFFGGLGGAITSSQCDAGTVASHLHYFVQFDRAQNDDVQYIRGISYDCARANGSVASNKCFGHCHDGDRSGGLGATFSNAGSPDVDNNCAPQLVVGLAGQSNQFVVALGAICAPLLQVVAANNQTSSLPIKTTGGAASKVVDNVTICQGGGGMTVTPVPGTASSVYVTFVAAPQGANVAQPGPGQCAWSSGPIGSVWKKLALGISQPIGHQLVQAAQNGGSFIVEAHTLGNGIVYVDRIDSAQPASGSSATVASTGIPDTAPPAGSGYVLACQGGGDMNISGGGATVGGPSYFTVAFRSAAQGANAAPPDPGTCAWVDRALRPGEPLVLNVPNQLAGADQLRQAIDGGTFQVHANTEGKELLVNQIDSAQPASAAAGGSDGTTTGGSGSGSALQPPIAGDDGGGQPATIAKAVNVHTTAGGGTVLGSLAAGTSVTLLDCSKSWCHVQFTGGDGYVAQSFLNLQ